MCTCVCSILSRGCLAVKDRAICAPCQVVDELSDDGTPQRLKDFGVKVLQPPERLGVTHNWNWVRVL